jgi:hypothetical protein
MKKRIFGIIILVAIGLATWWFIVMNRANEKYEQMKKGLVVTYTVKPMDEQFQASLAEVEKTWLVRSANSKDQSRPHSDALKLVGMSPSAANLTHLLTCPMPDWSWISPSRNKESVVLGMTKALLNPRTVDNALHLSQDKKVLAIWCTKKAMWVFRDDAQGMKETLYFLPRGEGGQQPAGAAGTPVAQP